MSLESERSIDGRLKLLAEILDWVHAELSIVEKQRAENEYLPEWLHYYDGKDKALNDLKRYLEALGK